MARAFKRIFSCKIWLRYSRERALSSLPDRASWRRTSSCARRTFGGEVSRKSNARVPRTALAVTYACSNFYSNFWPIFGKLWEARSPLYRSRILQVNSRWKPLAEIYKIYTLSHRSAFKISPKIRQPFFAFFARNQQKTLTIFNTKLRLKNGAKECIVQISATGFKRIFGCKIWLRYSGERAPTSSACLPAATPPSGSNKQRWPRRGRPPAG